MTPQELRHRYPKFIYDRYSYEFSAGNLHLKFHYLLPPNLQFVHKLSFIDVPHKADLDLLVFHIGLSEMFSYWKTACSPIVEITAGQLIPDQTKFWHKLFIQGMGEYFYQNQIDFTAPGFLSLISPPAGPPAGPTPPEIEDKFAAGQKTQILIPVGGGKDSVVTLELLKSQSAVVPFIVNPVPVMHDVCRTAGLTPLIVQRQLDPRLLKLNSQGFLNGHIPISAMYSFTSLLAAYLTDSQFIAFSNERSTSEGNTTYLGQEINHQYSKTLEFETDLCAYITHYLKLNIKYFSFLRPLYELQITKLFSKLPQYFPVSSSCNTNFKLDRTSQNLWCCHCPKCVSTALLLACFIGIDQVTKIMGAFPPDLPENQNILQGLLGQLPVKPFTCVLTLKEAAAALEKIRSGTSSAFDKLISSWFDSPNLPPDFQDLLKSFYDHS